MTAGKREKSTMASPTTPPAARGHSRATHPRSVSRGWKVNALSAVHWIGAVTPTARRRPAAARLRVTMRSVRLATRRTSRALAGFRVPASTA